MSTLDLLRDDVAFQSPVFENNKKKHLILTNYDRLVLYEKDPYSSLTPQIEWILELKYLIAGIDFYVKYNMIKIGVNQINIKKIRLSNAGNISSNQIMNTRFSFFVKQSAHKGNQLMES